MRRLLNQNHLLIKLKISSNLNAFLSISSMMKTREIINIFLYRFKSRKLDSMIKNALFYFLKISLTVFTKPKFLRKMSFWNCWMINWYKMSYILLKKLINKLRSMKILILLKNRIKLIVAHHIFNRLRKLQNKLNY